MCRSSRFRRYVRSSGRMMERMLEVAMVLVVMGWMDEVLLVAMEEIGMQDVPPDTWKWR
jgi:hypothetical protein